MRQFATWHFVALVFLTSTVALADGQHRFDAAIQREASGDYKGAAQALEELARAAPDDAFADDALFEAAVLAEERLGDPARAAKLFEAVATNYPPRRRARRARGRADFLASSLRTGEAPLAEYQRIVGSAAAHPLEAVAAMEALLAAHADFALADRALYWLGARYVEQKREADGAARFAEVERRFPSSEWAARAKKARADLLLHRGHPLQARVLYQQLDASADPMAHAAGKEGLGDARAAIARRVLVTLALAYLLGFVMLHLARLRGLRRLLPLPAELLYYAPVAVLFVVAGATENGAIGAATAGIAVGGALVIWIGAALTAAQLERGPVAPLGRVWRAGATALAILAVAFVAVQAAGLNDLVLETLRAGPER